MKRRRLLGVIAVGIAVAVFVFPMAGCSGEASSSASAGMSTGTPASEKTSETQSSVGKVRRSVDTEADLHVEMPEFSLDLPNYWLGRVDVEETDLGSIVVYPRGNHDCAFVRIGALNNSMVEPGDIGSGIACRVSMGNGRTVVISTTRFTVLVCDNPNWQERWLRLYSADGIAASIDLETGGQLTAGEASAKERDDVEDMVRAVNEYLNATITPTLVTHPENSTHVDNWLDPDSLPGKAADGPMLDGIYSRGNYFVAFEPDGTCSMGVDYASHPGEYEYDPSSGWVSVTIHGYCGTYEVYNFIVRDQELINEAGPAYRKTDGT